MLNDRFRIEYYLKYLWVLKSKINNYVILDGVRTTILIKYNYKYYIFDVVDYE